MNYTLSATSSSQLQGNSEIRNNEIKFGITKDSKLLSPAELLVAAFAACCLKNIQRFSDMMKFTYHDAGITVNAQRQDKPPMINELSYEIVIKSTDPKLNSDLLLRNIQKYGTIYNTLNTVCEITGSIKIKQQD